MSQNKQLPKEARFVYQVFQTASAMSRARFRDGKMTNAEAIQVMPKMGDRDVIIAGGAVRDLYFGRSSRDVDVYYNAKEIDAASFANCLNRLDINAMARAAGFQSVTVRRNSDGTMIGKKSQDDEDGEDWGDVSEDARIALRSWATYYHNAISGGFLPRDAVLYAHKHVPDANVHMQVRANHDYVTYLVESGGQSGSSSGSKMASTHPLKSVEEFRFIFDEYNYVDVELMGVAAKPIEYMMSHFAIKLSRAYYDGAGVHFTSDFMQDARNKTLTVACPIEHARFDRLFSYYLPKMKKYFPDFEVRVDLNAMNGRDW
ncbi:hypothetical protein D3C75_697780 [compost metagenome]